MKALLITGGAGFIGSHFIPLFLAQKKDWMCINLDCLSYAADLKNLNKVKDHPRYRFIEGNICNKEIVNQIFSDYEIHGVIHFAAESHVDNSIASPYQFVASNVMGTYQLLQSAYQHWMIGPHQKKANYQDAIFYYISTDEVYGSIAEGSFTEESACRPNSPYSASKAAGDHFVRSYQVTYGLNTLISHSSNNYGPHQHDEKLIPTVIRHALQKKPIPIYGDGENCRDWLHVDDHCQAVFTIWQNGKIGETYNIGGYNELSNLELVKKILTALAEGQQLTKNFYFPLMQFVKDRPGHDWRYAIDSQKLKTNLGWKPEYDLKVGLEQTIDWYMKKYEYTDSLVAV